MQQRQLVVCVSNAVRGTVAVPKTEDGARPYKTKRKQKARQKKPKWRSVQQYRAQCANCCKLVPLEVLTYLSVAKVQAAKAEGLAVALVAQMDILAVADPTGTIMARYRQQCDEEFRIAKKKGSLRALRERVADAIDSRMVTGKPKCMLKEKEIASVGTARSMRSSVTQFALWLQENDLPWSTEVPIILVLAFLDSYRRRVKQNTLNTMRRYLNWFYAIALPPVKAFFDGPSKHRALTQEELGKLFAAISGMKLMLIRLLLENGFRPCEMLTIARPCELPALQRGLLPQRFLGQENGVPYTSNGKGGGIWEERVALDLSHELEQYRRPTPIKVEDHECRVLSYYNIPGGARLTRIIGDLSEKVLGWRATPTSYRYTFAQALLRRFAAAGFEERVALKAIAQRMGHLSPEKSLPYVKPIRREFYPS